MDTFSKTVVSIRNEARSSVYRRALGSHRGCAYGFLLGQKEPLDSPAIEFSLVSGVPMDDEEFLQGPGRLVEQLSAAQQTAEHAGVKVIGVFLAKDLFFHPHRYQLTGIWADLAVELRLPFLVIFPTSGFETIWGVQCFFANSFPPSSLSCRATRGKLSIHPRHNPRRVRAFWNQLLKRSQDA